MQLILYHIVLILIVEIIDNTELCEDVFAYVL